MSNDHPGFRLIWITPRFPLGTADGARHATRTLIDHLTQLQIGIDLICLLPAGDRADSTAAQKQLNLSSCSIISRHRSLFQRFPRLKTPFTFRTFVSSDVRLALKERLASCLKASDPSQNVFLVFDTLHPFASLHDSDLKELSSISRGIVYRAHNVETTLWEQCEQRARTPWFRWFFHYQAALVRTFERRIARQVHGIAPVSEEDAAKFKRVAPETRVAVVPIGMDFPREETIRPVDDSATMRFLFIGRLDWIPNRNGLTWFLENVWPRLLLKRQNIALTIAGIGDGRWLQRFQKLNGIELLGKVDDLKPLYEACTVSIAPLFQGSGTRVKIIESARYARAVVTTALGAEGSGLHPGSSYFKAETQEDWLAMLETMKKDECRHVGLAAFQSLSQRFDGKRVAQQFIQMLKSI